MKKTKYRYFVNQNSINSINPCIVDLAYKKFYTVIDNRNKLLLIKLII